MFAIAPTTTGPNFRALDVLPVETIVDAGTGRNFLKGMSGMRNQQQVFVSGYYTAGDGGGGTFYWDSSSSASDNGGTIIAPDAGGTGRWRRVYSGDLQAEWFGAIPGQSAAIVSAALQAAENARASGQTLVWPSGTIAINADVTAASPGRWVMPGGTVNSAQGRLIISRDNFEIEAHGATFNFTGSASDTEYRRAIRAGGGLSAEYGVSGTIAVGATSFVADTLAEAATLAAGDWVHVVNHDPTNYIQIEMKQVASVSGTTINVTSPFGQAFDGTYPIEWLKVVTKYENIKIRGLKVYCPDPGADGLAVDIQPGIFNFEMSDMDITMDRGYGFAVYGVFNPKILNNRIRRHKGQSAAISSVHGGYTEGNTWFVEGDAGTNSAIKLETGTYAHHFKNNQVFGLNGGSGTVYVNNVNHSVFEGNTFVGRTAASNAVSINGSSNNIFANNRVINASGGFVISVDTQPTPDLLSLNNTFVGNVVRNASEGITNAASCTATVIGLDTDSTVTTPINNSGTMTAMRRNTAVGALSFLGGVHVGNAAVSNANVLDWYEEGGTFTPALTFSTPGNLAVTYGTQTGTYRRVGNRIEFELTVVTNTFTHTTASGNFQVSGLPYNAKAATGIAVTVADGWTKANYTYTAAAFNAGAATLTIQVGGSGQARANLTTAEVASGGTPSLKISGNYEIE